MERTRGPSPSPLADLVGGHTQTAAQIAARSAIKGELHGAHDHTRASRRIAGISLGGIIVIIGIVLMFVWSIIGGLIVVLIGLIAFGGFAWGRWY